jgi:hypothetical protein
MFVLQTVWNALRYRTHRAVLNPQDGVIVFTWKRIPEMPKTECTLVWHRRGSEDVSWTTYLIGRYDTAQTVADYGVDQLFQEKEDVPETIRHSYGALVDAIRKS